VSRALRCLLVVFAVLTAGAVAVAVLAISRGVSAREAPGRLETYVARNLRHLAIPAGARGMANPLPASGAVLAGGLAHFADHCAVCHGNDGSGDTAFGRNLFPKPPDMRRKATLGLSDGELFYIIEHGVRFTGMPAFGDGTDESARDTWALVHFIRRLPELTGDELARMRSLNPRTAEEWLQEEEIRRFLSGDDPGPTPGGHQHRNPGEDR